MDEENDQSVTIAEIEEVSAETSGDGGGATVLLSLEEMIKSHIDSLEKLRQELRQNREMFEDAFNNNPTYREHLEKVKEANKGKGSIRQEIAKQPSIMALSDKVKSLRQEIKERQMALSDYLLEYQRMTGANEIEGNDGQVREIVNTSRVVKKSS